ncbi:MAG: adenosylcobalamin-dependent ribonucleoside-diphosphate reductase [Bacteroidales bacterium]|nr:adenosylcobalamin-dependent ribonucleoside-diphosphate reductase [Bacteroidales bacterium]
MIQKNRKTYSEQEVVKSTLTYFNGDQLAVDVWKRKYCLKDNKNYYELNPDDMHWRLANEFARIEAKYPNPLSANEIYETIKNFKRIVPQGGSMSGIGNNFQIISLSNCFVIGNTKDSDSYGGIMKLDQDMVQLQKRRGGVGLDLSFVRPKGSPVKNSAITSTGIVPFMERYSNSTKEVAQDGRRGALMESISIIHPDSEDFIDAKMSKGEVTGANISVRISNEFMKAAKYEYSFEQKYPIDSQQPKYTKDVDATRIWKKIIYNAWKSAEPGILFWDKVISESIPDCYADLGFKTTSTNPCGEIPLCPYDSCRLLSLNLFGYVVNPFTPEAYFDWKLFKDDVIKAMRYMDDLIDLELEKIDNILAKIKSDPEDEFIKLYEINLWTKIREKTIEGRRTGLGVTAEGDMLAALGYTYGTDLANDFSENVHEKLKLKAYESSIILAKERGAFPIYDWKREKNNSFILRIKEADPELYADMVKYGRRNIALLTIAPTGTASLMTQTTSGIEPVFLPVYKRRRKINPQEKDIQIDFVDDEGIAWKEYLVFHNKFETWLRVNDYDIDVVRTMTEEQVDEIIKKSPYYKATSNNVDWVKKVEMQGRIQKHVDHSISVTVNLPEEATEDLVRQVYETGWFVGCKGMTVYREGSRSGVLVSNEKKKKKLIIEEVHAPKRPKRLKSEIHRFQNKLEKWIAVVGIKDGHPYEIFTGKFENGLSNLPVNLKECEVVKNIVEVDDVDETGKTIKVKKKRYDIEYVDSNSEKHVYTGLNHAFNPEFWNYSKFISGVLRHRMPLVYVFELIDSLTFKEDYINTWKNGISRVIKKYIKNGEKGKGTCPVCGSNDLQYKEGCLICMGCGNSKCG